MVWRKAWMQKKLALIGQGMLDAFMNIETV
jgi:hypothetical protein